VLTDLIKWVISALPDGLPVHAVLALPIPAETGLQKLINIFRILNLCFRISDVHISQVLKKC